MCSAQHLGRYLKGQGHSMTLKLNHVQTIISLFEVSLKLFHRNDDHFETMCCMQDLGRYLEGRCHSITLEQKRVRPITLLFEVRFYNYMTEMISILR